MRRKEAKELNERYFTTGKMCKNGHFDKRFTHNGACYSCVQIASKNNWKEKRINLEARQKQIYNALKNRCQRTTIAFDLKFDDIVWPQMCPALNIELNYISQDEHTDFSPSFDRLDPSKGYTKDNVRIVSNRANRIRYNANAQELIQIALYLIKET